MVSTLGVERGEVCIRAGVEPTKLGGSGALAEVPSHVSSQYNFLSRI